MRIPYRDRWGVRVGDRLSDVILGDGQGDQVWSGAGSHQTSLQYGVCVCVCVCVCV